MSVENVAVVRRLFDAVARRDLPSVLDAYDPDIRITEPASLPYGGDYRGHAGAARHGAAYVATWSRFQTAAEQALDPRFLDAGEHVVVLWRQRARSGSGESLDLPAIGIYRVANGRVLESRMYQDTAAIARFLERAHAPHS